MIRPIVAVLLLASSAHAECNIAFDCKGGKATINGNAYPIVCARHTARGIDGGTLGSWFKANGKWRPGLVRPGTPMISTSPMLCYDCHIHVTSDFSFSNGCLGTTAAAFKALKACAGSKFSISRR
jgi:hypothetical protein